MKSRWVFIFMVAAMLVLGATATALAAEPVQCTYQSFTWQCTDGSEKFANEPTPPISGLGGNGYFESVHFSDAGFGANAYVQMSSEFALRFKTTQRYVSWWGTDGALHVAERLNGVVTIPNGAVMIGIPGDVLGDFDLPGWIKGKLTSTGEYVLGSTAWIQ